jgi:hypothetical protein
MPIRINSQTNKGTTSLLAMVDHLVYATPDLDSTIDKLDRLLGVHATAGGQHPGRGTRNALIGLGTASYLEIIGPDPAQPKPAAPRAFKVDTLREPKLAGWGAKTNDLPRLVQQAAEHGVTVGAPTSGSRRLPDGGLLTWQFNDPRVVLGDGIVPFFIDWGSSPHPARIAATGASLIELRAEHPHPEEVQRILDHLGIDLHVTKGSEPALIATINSAHGRIELR